MRAANVRFVPIADMARLQMGLHPIRMLERYLVKVGPSSRERLKISPHG